MSIIYWSWFHFFISLISLKHEYWWTVGSALFFSLAHCESKSKHRHHYLSCLVEHRRSTERKRSRLRRKRLIAFPLTQSVYLCSNWIRHHRLLISDDKCTRWVHFVKIRYLLQCIKYFTTHFVKKVKIQRSFSSKFSKLETYSGSLASISPSVSFICC